MINFYPIPGKRKSRLIGEAFVAGCGGRLIVDNTLREGDGAFYGVDHSVEHIWRTILHDHSRNFYYIDNAYLDETRQTYFRITKNMLQCSGAGKSDCARFDGFGLQIRPWRTSGTHIVLCEQSSSFMQLPVGYAGNWLSDTSRTLQQLTKRPLRARRWLRDKAWASHPLPEDLAGAHALVTWSSAAAVTSIIHGVPVIVQGQSPAASMSGSFADIERLPTPDRHEWLGVLADNQFTTEEMRNGYAWSKVK